MNVYTDLGNPVSVWETEHPSKSIADVSFAPTSVTGIELTNDYEPVQYQANRSLMAANAAQEINDLQERNHATTAYSTLDCYATPLFPTFNGQRAADCAIRQARRAGVPLGMHDLVAQPVPPLGYPPQQVMGTPGYYRHAGQYPVVVEKKKPHQPGGGNGSELNFFKRMANSVRGSFYDAKHWKELPPKVEGQSTGEVLSFVVTRDDRLGYLLLWITMIVMLITLIGVAAQVGRG
jgi:hypothetical protein